MYGGQTTQEDSLPTGAVQNQPLRQTSVNAIFSRFEKSVVMNRKHVEDLIGRIAPILNSSEVPTERNKESADQGYVSPIANDMAKMVRQIEETNSLLELIISRVEL